MNWLLSLAIYFLGLLIGIAIFNRRAYRRGLRDGRVTTMLRYSLHTKSEAPDNDRKI